MKASGAGSSIVSEPNIGSLVDFGTSFSGGLVQRKFKLTNKSSRHQNLSFQLGENVRQISNHMKKEIVLKDKTKVTNIIFLSNIIHLDAFPSIYNFKF